MNANVERHENALHSPSALVLLAVIVADVLAAAPERPRRADQTPPSRPTEGPFTSLKITYQRGVYQNGKAVRVVAGQPFLLGRDPPAGNVTNPTEACRLLRANPARFVGRASTSCLGGLMRWNVAIQGLLFGHPIRRLYDMCDYPEARAWTDLGGTQLIGIVPSGSPEAQAGPQNH